MKGFVKMRKKIFGSLALTTMLSLQVVSATPMTMEQPQHDLSLQQVESMPMVGDDSIQTPHIMLPEQNMTPMLGELMDFELMLPDYEEMPQLNHFVGGMLPGDDNIPVGDLYHEGEGFVHVTPPTTYVGEATSELDGVVFEDLVDHWAAEIVERVVEMGLFRGRTDTIFAPDDNMTRAEFVTCFVQAFIQDRASVEAPSVWYEEFYLALEEKGFLVPGFTLENATELISVSDIQWLFSAFIAQERGLNPLELDASDLFIFPDDIFNESVCPDGVVSRAVAATAMLSWFDENLFLESGVGIVGQVNFFEPQYNTEFLGSERSQELANAIMNARPDIENQHFSIIQSTEDIMSAYLFPSLQFDPLDAEGFAISTAMMNTTAYSVVAITPVDDVAFGRILEGIEFFRNSKVQSFHNYLADQFEIAQNSVIKVLDDNTILLVMCENQDEIAANIITELNSSLKTVETLAMG